MGWNPGMDKSFCIDNRDKWVPFRVFATVRLFFRKKIKFHQKSSSAVLVSVLKFARPKGLNWRFQHFVIFCFE